MTRYELVRHLRSEHDPGLALVPGTSLAMLEERHAAFHAAGAAHEHGLRAALRSALAVQLTRR